jgi:hypothetical protein
MIVAITALTSILVGLVLAGVIGIWITVSQLADLKAKLEELCATLTT